MNNRSSLLIIPLVMLNATNSTEAYKHIVPMDFADGCPITETRLDVHEEVLLMTDRSPDIPVTISPTTIKGGKTCEARFFTSNRDHGVCFTPNNLFFKQMGVSVSLWTAKDYADVTFDRYHYKNVTEWCTDKRQVTLVVNVPDYIQDQNAEFRFSFSVRNRTKTDIIKTYTMDSYRECDLYHVVTPGQSLMIKGQRYPAVQTMPLTCKVSISSSASEEFEQLCVTLTYIVDQNCNSQLSISGFNENWWDNDTKSFGCHDHAPKGHVTTSEMCSKDKRLTFGLTREGSNRTGVDFTATVTSKWHPHWEAESSTQSQKKGFHFMQGFTYFIAAVDTLAGIIAAALATMIRHPRGPWKNWMEGSQTQEDTQPYEVNYPTVSTSRMEEGSSPEVTGY